jgi:hypothetical protein
MLLLESSDHRGIPVNDVRGGVTDMAVDHVPEIVDCRTTSASSGARSIKNFFRKRHKSTSSG